MMINKCKELEIKLNENCDPGYESYSVWECEDNKTDIHYSNIDSSKRYVFNTDDINTIAEVFASGNEEQYCVSSSHYDLD